MSTTAAEKAVLRRALRGVQAEWSVQARAQSDGALFRRFLALPEVEAARTLLLFSGMKAEPDTARLMNALLERGKAVALPRCRPGNRMEAARVEPGSGLVRHPYGMLEPGADCPIVERDRLDLILVPGICYDKFCYRLGQGGGYYDRYLERFRGFTVGLCREAFLREAVPREAHDRRVDLVLTEERAFRACPAEKQRKAGP